MNNVQLSGRLTKDPDVRTTTGGKKYARITVAVSRNHKTASQQADFINCVAWDKLADILEKYFQKGKGIVISKGRITTNAFTNKEGKRVNTTDVTIEEMEFPLLSKAEQAQAAAQEPQTDGPAVTNPQTQAEFVPMESDIEIPFE